MVCLAFHGKSLRIMYDTRCDSRRSCFGIFRGALLLETEMIFRLGHYCAAIEKDSQVKRGYDE